MAVVISRFDVVLVGLDPTVGREMKKTRPCLVISPNDLHRYISTVIIAPMTTGGPLYVTRIPCTFDGKNGHIVLDQIRTVDKARIVRTLGKIESESEDAVLSALFAR